MSDAKKAALMIIAGKPKPEEGAEEMPELPELMAELGAALKAGDYEGAASAFRAAMDCEYESDEEE